MFDDYAGSARLVLKGSFVFSYNTICPWQFLRQQQCARSPLASESSFFHIYILPDLLFLLFQSVSLSFDSSLSILNIKTRNLLYIDPLRNHACIPSAVQAASQVGACDMRVINSDQYDCISQQLFCLLCRGLCLYISLSLLYMSFSYDAYGKFYKFK